MIGRLKGIILEKEPPLALLEIGGVAYEIHVPMTCFYKLPDTGQEAIVFTQCIMREDVQILYGFNNKQEQILFRELIKINGIGLKLAFSILSSISAKQFFNAIKYSDKNMLIKIPGLGKKTAERLIIEIKNRFKDLFHENFSFKTDDLIFSTSITSKINIAKQEAISALVTLGYKLQDAKRMVNKVTIPNASRETLIREALRAVLEIKI